MQQLKRGGNTVYKAPSAFAHGIGSFVGATRATRQQVLNAIQLFDVSAFSAGTNTNKRMHKNVHTHTHVNMRKVGSKAHQHAQRLASRVQNARQTLGMHTELKSHWLWKESKQSPLALLTLLTEGTAMAGTNEPKLPSLLRELSAPSSPALHAQRR
jgi:alcohol dehydrogenase class IV